MAAGPAAELRRQAVNRSQVMPISVTCQCGKRLHGKAELAGNRVTCAGGGGWRLVCGSVASRGQGGGATEGPSHGGFSRTRATRLARGSGRTHGRGSRTAGEGSARTEVLAERRLVPRAGCRRLAVRLR